MTPEQADQLQRQIQSHQRDSTSSSHRSTSIESSRASSSLDPRATSPQGHGYGYGHPYQPPSHVARFQEQQLGGMRHGSAGSSASASSHRPPSPDQYDPTRSGTMMSADYRFNPAAQPISSPADLAPWSIHSKTISQTLPVNRCKSATAMAAARADTLMHFHLVWAWLHP